MAQLKIQTKMDPLRTRKGEKWYHYETEWKRKKVTRILKNDSLCSKTYNKIWIYLEKRKGKCTTKNGRNEK